ncbi:MAG: nucleoside hydrolase [Tatlockia sp.]|nr:nucleoside hydrolase [Tatlockia sp.]
MKKKTTSISHNEKLTIVFNSDVGVDDALAHLLILSQTKNNPLITIPGIVATVGNGILGQTAWNVRRILELVQQKNIKVYLGALTPLGLEKNVTEVDKGINATHFYGRDALSDQPPKSWPPVTIPLEIKKGYEFIAELIINASAENPITLVSTAALTEVYKSLMYLEELCEKNNLPSGCFAHKFKLVAMGGIIDPSNGANAPFGWPKYNNKTCTPKYPPCMNAEANFFWDTHATKGVFDFLDKYGIVMELITLDLTQKPGLLWTKKQVVQLQKIANPVAAQFANVTDVVPWIDAKNFPNGTYPWHDGLTSAWILWGEKIFKRINVAIAIGAHGETLVNSNPKAFKNVDLITISPENMALCMQQTIDLVKNFKELEFEQESIPLLASNSYAIEDLISAGIQRKPALFYLLNELYLLKNYLKPFFADDSLVSAKNITLPAEKNTELVPVSSETKSLISPMQSGFTRGFRDGLLQKSISHLFFKQGMGEWEIKLAVQGIAAASIASVNLPAALLYIALFNLPDNSLSSFDKQIFQAVAGLDGLISDPYNFATSGLSHIVGFYLAHCLVDQAVNLLSADNEVGEQKCCI